MDNNPTFSKLPDSDFRLDSDSIHCHTHNQCNSEHTHLQKQNLDMILQKHEDKLVQNIKKLVSDMKEEVLTEMNSSCVVSKCYQSNPSLEEYSSDSTEHLTFPFPLSELDDSSEVEFEVIIGKKKSVTLDRSSGKKRKILYVDEETALLHKRVKAEIENDWGNYNYKNTPSLSHSSPLEHKNVAKALNFSSCSSESDESVFSSEPENIKNKCSALSKASSPLGKWKVVESLDTILEAPDETFQEYSGDSSSPHLSSGNTLTLSPVSSEPSNFSDPESLDMKTEGNYYKNLSCQEIDAQYEADPFYDFAQMDPPLKTYFRSCLKLEAIQEEDELQEQEDCNSFDRTM